MLAPTPCLDCHNYAVNRGRCKDHQVAWKGSTRRERLPADWRTRRIVVLKRDKGICYICKQEGADTVDHVIPGDDHGLHNLAAVHDRVPPHCHRKKSSEEGNAAQKGNKIKRRF